MAKAYASDVAKTVTSEAIQVHGGIGFTWEHDAHLYHRRALASRRRLRQRRRASRDGRARLYVAR